MYLYNIPIIYIYVYKYIDGSIYGPILLHSEPQCGLSPSPLQWRHENENSRKTLFKTRAPENRSHHGLARARCREQRTPQENRTKAKSNERTAVKAKVHTGEMQGLQESSCS